MTARRPLLTATVAGSVLLALWFVPSANANAGGGAAPVDPRTAAAPRHGAVADAGAAATVTGEAGTPQQLLAATGSPESTPYVIGGAACLALGAGLVSYSVRRTVRPAPR
ncbi:hypothetical protein [Streptomyces sp. NPDC048650]|uniref:hypothetical protein n=1 Tax=unclassified Streptomyces TaxID=2593676 RepID=UPI003719FCA5